MCAAHLAVNSSVSLAAGVIEYTFSVVTSANVGLSS